MSTSKSASVKSGFELSASGEHTISDMGAFVNVEVTGVSHENSTSAVLNYCKLKVLHPYFRLLSTLGWRPLMSSRPSPFFNFLVKTINATYSFVIILLILSGYFLSYCTCYRGDGLPHLPLIDLKSDYYPNHHTEQITTTTTTEIPTTTEPSHGLNEPNSNQLEPRFERTVETHDKYHSTNSTCNNKLISHFIIPDILHFLGYLYVFYLLRAPECERLENLMERGFLQTSQTTGWFMENRRLISTLRSFLLMSLIWVLVSVTLHLTHFKFATICFPCLPITLSHHWHSALTYLTVASITCFDIICSAVVCSYAVHCQLNISFINNLCQGVREKRITFQEFYQRAEESRKFVDYLNNDQAIGVSLLLVVFICKICLYSYEVLSKTNDIFGYIMLASGLTLWTVITLLPLIQGIRLTSVCGELKRIGHELKARPFGYQDADEFDLNSLLLYTSSLEMEAKIFHIPIRASSVITVFSIILIGLPLLGQINVISL